MNWPTLFSARRTGDANDGNMTADPARNSFVRDYDRIIFSSAFRRLQNKTQVFPLPGAVFVHNRLTHSLEVACVGRSLGKIAGEQIAEHLQQPDSIANEFYRHELSSVIAAACLAHDIGNPPFGHSGEDAIRDYFCRLGGANKQRIREELTDNQIRDFEFFEGNANAFRTLTHHFIENERGGYRLTYATLAAIVKYPCSSQDGFSKTNGLIATKKSGFFDSEITAFADVAKTLQVPKLSPDKQIYARHPFVYLTEAADDICYRIIDMEDAHRLGIISINTIEEYFLPFFNAKIGYESKDYVHGKMKGIKDKNQKVQYLRARWIGLMADRVGKAFEEHEGLILSGNLQCSLLACLSKTELSLVNDINAFSVKFIYNHRSVAEVEIAGFNVIGGLLNEFVTAVLHRELVRSAKLLKLIPSQFPLSVAGIALYADLQSIVDFISGMTDLFAIDLYRKITGISTLNII